MTARLVPAALAAVLLFGACGSESQEVSVVSIVPLEESGAESIDDLAADTSTDDGASPSDDQAPANTAEQLIPAGGSVGESRLVRAAQVASQATTSFRFEATIEMSGMPGMGVIEMPFVGEFDHRNDRMGMEMDLTSMLSQIADDGAQNMPGTMRMIIDGDVAYMNMGQLGAVFGAGPDGWVRIDSNAADTGSMMSGTSDPRAFVSLLAGDNGGITEVGREDVRGVSTTHYRGTLDMAAAMEMADADQREDLAAAMSAQGLSLDTLGDLVIPAEVWIDDDDQVRRFSLTMDLAAMGEAFGEAELGQDELGQDELAAATMVMDMEMFDYGAEIDIALPSPQDVVDITDSMAAGS